MDFEDFPIFAGFLKALTKNNTAILRTLGPAGFVAGMQATVCKHFAHSCVYFATFAELTKACPEAQGLPA